MLTRQIQAPTVFCAGVAGTAWPATCGLPFATSTTPATASAALVVVFPGPSPKSPKDFSLSLPQIQRCLNYKDRMGVCREQQPKESPKKGIPKAVVSCTLPVVKLKRRDASREKNSPSFPCGKTGRLASLFVQGSDLALASSERNRGLVAVGESKSRLAAGCGRVRAGW